MLLCEGPDAASPLVTWCKRQTNAENNETSLTPPVALLVYAPEKPSLSAFYPFAEFSPEWQAILYANEQNIPFQFFDLPQQQMLMLQQAISNQTETAQDYNDPNEDWYAQQFGYSDSEHWWDYWIESRPEQVSVFESVAQMMQMIRAGRPHESPPILLRESAMRLVIDEVLKKNPVQKLAVICGAYHVPALQGQRATKADREALKNLPKIKVNATWIPWTYERLAIRSGYGAGIHSPRWYEYIWQHQKDALLVFMAEAASLLRQHGLNASTAQVTEAVALAQTLAQMREKGLAGLDELKAAALAVLCEGQEAVFAVVEQELVVGKRMGTVPVDMPAMPIQKDFYAWVKKFRLKLSPTKEVLELDLRQDAHRQKSAFLHRCLILSINFAFNRYTYNKKGTFHDYWELRWRPEYELCLVEANRWGSTIESAALSRALENAQNATSAEKVSELLGQLLLADLPSAVPYLLEALRNKTADTADVTVLIEAAKPLAAVLRYGSVRKTDQEAVFLILSDLSKKICIGLPNTAKQANEDAATKIAECLEDLQQIVRKLADRASTSLFEEMLLQLALGALVHGIVAGRACRMCLDAALMSEKVLSVQMSLALSARCDALHAANWLDGFLSGSAQLLIYNDKLFELLNSWLVGLSELQFIEAVAILRRSFARYSQAERERIREKSAMNSLRRTKKIGISELDSSKLPLLAELFTKLGYKDF